MCIDRSSRSIWLISWARTRRCRGVIFFIRLVYGLLDGTSSLKFFNDLQPALLELSPIGGILFEVSLIGFLEWDGRTILLTAGILITLSLARHLISQIHYNRRNVFTIPILDLYGLRRIFLDQRMVQTWPFRQNHVQYKDNKGSESLERSQIQNRAIGW